MLRCYLIRQKLSVHPSIIIVRSTAHFHQVPKDHSDFASGISECFEGGAVDQLVGDLKVTLLIGEFLHNRIQPAPP